MRNEDEQTTKQTNCYTATLQSQKYLQNNYENTPICQDNNSIFSIDSPNDLGYKTDPNDSRRL